MELQGHTALVTGGTRGIGRAVASRLVSAGADVIVTGASSEPRAPDGCSYEQVDFANDTQTKEFCRGLAKGAPIDLLVNNAGINIVSPFDEITDADFDRVQRVNLYAPMVLSRAVLAGMRERGWGRIVNVTSIWSVVSKAGRASYAASKSGLVALTKTLAIEVAGDGILANCIAPGFVDTDLTRAVLGAQGIASMIATVPAGRLAKPEEIAEAVLFLGGHRNTFITGQNLIIDGGFTST